MRWDLDCDAILMGTGPGSLLAASKLVAHGLKPLIVEKTKWVGGATAYSGGIIWVPNNHRMRAKGLADSREEALAYLERVSCVRGDRQVAEAYVDVIGRIAEDLQARTPLRWVTYPDLPDYYAEIPGGKASGRYLLPHGDLVRGALDAATERWPQMRSIRPAVHLGEQRMDWVWGRALVGCLWARVLEDEVPYLLEHRGVSLVRDKTRIEGAVLSGPDGPMRVRARLGVLLNTGGFEWNEEMTRLHVPGPRFHPQTPPANEGDGHIMAAEVGASLALMDQTIGMPSVCVAGEMNDDRQLYRILFQELALPHSMLVNASGRRFANESYFVDVARAWSLVDSACSSPNLPCYFLFDDNYRLKYGFPGGLSPPDSVHQHHSLAGLAARLGIDAAGLASQVRRYNDAVAAQQQDEFDRGRTAYQRMFGDKTMPGNPTLGIIERSPFYGMEIHPATSSHRGGVLIDRDARALDLRGNAIPGLFACGSCAAGSLTGGNYFTGAAVGHSIAFGTLAAERMIADREQRKYSL